MPLLIHKEVFVTKSEQAPDFPTNVFAYRLVVKTNVPHALGVGVSDAVGVTVILGVTVFETVIEGVTVGVIVGETVIEGVAVCVTEGSIHNPNARAPAPPVTR